MRKLNGPTGRVLRLRRSENRAAAPEDFEDFWARTAVALAGILPEAQKVHFDEIDAPGVSIVEFTSWGGQKVRAWVSEPVAGPPRPLLVTSHGYGGKMDPERVRRLATFGFNVIGVDFRGYGLSRNAVSGVSPWGYLLTGIESRETSILRGVVCDYIQAYRAGLQWFGPSSRVTFQGFSFSGGIAIMAASVLCMGDGRGGEFEVPRPPHILACGAPTLGDLYKRLVLCKGGSGAEVSEFLRMNPLRKHEVLRVLSYFDTSYFAPYLADVHGEHSALPERIIAGVGLSDPVVPAETVYSIYNALSVHYELHELPCSHTERPEEVQWVRWESAWIRATRDG